jgi:hypothetical protein
MAFSYAAPNLPQADNLDLRAPTVTLERIPSGTESVDATTALLSMYPGVKMDAQIAVRLSASSTISDI